MCPMSIHPRLLTLTLSKNVGNVCANVLWEIEVLNYFFPLKGPYGRLASASTPDLNNAANLAAANANNSNNVDSSSSNKQAMLLGGSSPDLVSRKNLQNSIMNNNNNNGNVYKTLENLNRLDSYNRTVSCEGEPIYQNQREVGEEGEDQEEGEPIYQNLPVHEKILFKQRLQQQQEQEQRSTTTTKLRGHVSRVAITNSRENNLDLSANVNFVYEEGGVIHGHREEEEDEQETVTKKSVTKINIGGSNSNVGEESNYDKTKEFKDLQDEQQQQEQQQSEEQQQQQQHRAPPRRRDKQHKQQQQQTGDVAAVAVDRAAKARSYHYQGEEEEEEDNRQRSKSQQR